MFRRTNDFVHYCPLFWNKIKCKTWVSNNRISCHTLNCKRLSTATYWQTDKLTNWHTGKMTNWQNESLADRRRFRLPSRLCFCELSHGQTGIPQTLSRRQSRDEQQPLVDFMQILILYMTHKNKLFLLDCGNTCQHMRSSDSNIYTYSYESCGATCHAGIVSSPLSVPHCGNYWPNFLCGTAAYWFSILRD